MLQVGKSAQPTKQTQVRKKKKTGLLHGIECRFLCPRPDFPWNGHLPLLRMVGRGNGAIVGDLERAQNIWGDSRNNQFN